jgi:hypothetical protein
MEQVHRARAQGQEKAAVDATQKADPRRHRDSGEPDPAEVRAGAPDRAGAKTEAPDRAGATSGPNESTYQLFNQLTISKGGVLCLD